MSIAHRIHRVIASVVFLLGAGYVFLKNAHVRIDFISGKLSARANALIDVIGEHAAVDRETASERLEALRQSGRYARDVY